MFEQSKFGAWDHQDKIQLLRSHNSSRKSEYTCHSSCEPVSYQGGNVWGQEISGHKKKIYIFLSFHLFLFILLKNKELDSTRFITITVHFLKTKKYHQEQQIPKK